MTFSISISTAAATTNAARRQPLYVSSSTQSAAISVNGGTAVVTNLSATSPSCKAGAAGGRTCTVTVSAPAGSDTFAVALYASANGSGQVLSQNTISSPVVAGTANTVNVVLDGVVSTMSLAVANAAPAMGTPTSIPMTVTFKDASGATILGNDPFANPVTLTDSDTSGATKVLPATLLNSPADAVGLTVSYSGASIGKATFGATASGITPAAVTPVSIVPVAPATNSRAFVDWPTYAYDSQRSGYNPYTTGITPASIANVKIGWQTAIKGSTQTQPIVITNVPGQADPLLVVANFAIAQAYDALTGKRIWQTTLPTQNVQDCGVAGVSGTAVYDKAANAIFMAAGNGGTAPNHPFLYKLDPASGGIIGSGLDLTPTLQPGEANTAHAGLTLANGRIYVGLGSNCEGTASGNYVSWRGGVVAVDPNSMSILRTFYTTYGQGPNGENYGGGGIWAWGGVSSDAGGNVFLAAGNAETAGSVQNRQINPPFVVAPNEQVGYGEHLVELSSDLSSIENSNYPTFDFGNGGDLDYTGVPVVFQPPMSSGCGEMTATQGKGGKLVINNAANFAVVNSFNLSIPSGAAYYIGNPAFSPATGFLYAAITSTGAGSSMLQPGLAAIGGCGSTMPWHAQFGPDSSLYPGENPRSAPTVTAGGVVFMGTPCTNDGNGGCGAPGKIGGALWAIDAASPTVLNGGRPLVITDDNIRMAPSADGLWIYVLDGSGNLYGLTVDPSVRGVAAKLGTHVSSRFRVRGN